MLFFIFIFRQKCDILKKYIKNKGDFIVEGFDIILHNILLLAAAMAVGFTAVKTGYVSVEVKNALSKIIVRIQRTAPEIRHYFDKFGKGMGAQGCVSWSFDRKGVIVINNEDEELDEETVMMDALDAGAEDIEADGPVFEVTTDPDSFNDVVKALEAKGYTFASAEIEMVPQNYVTMSSEEDVKSMEKLLDMLDDNDDVQNVWHNWQQD